MKNILILSLLLIILGSCKEEFSVSKSIIDKETFPHFIEKETFEDTAIYRNATSLRRARYEFLYLGKEQDTIELNYFINFRPPPPPPPGMEKNSIILTNDNPFENYRIDWRDRRDFYHCESSKMEIKVDTSRIVKNRDFRFDSKYEFSKATLPDGFQI